MKTKLFKFLTLSFMMVFQWGFAQTNVSGTVSDDSGSPIPGATVVVLGTSNGVTTDFDGVYSISANQGDVLSVSYVGYTSQTATVGSSATINFTLTADTQLEEVIVAGVAGATSKKKLSVTVASLKAEDIEEVPASSAAGALLGKVAGVSIANLGRPGAGSTIILRGAANFYGSQEPLVLVDGVLVGSLDDVNVDDIASFEIVKGASAAALYGSRAGNGVIVISTKRGQIGKTQVTFRSETGFNKITNYMESNQSHGWTLADDWQNVQGQYTKLAGVTYPAGFASVYALAGPQGTIGARLEDADNYADNPYGVYRDFQDEFFHEGITSTNYVSVSSGTENARSLFSFENTRNEGVVRMTEGYKRQSFRANLDYDLSDKLTFKTSNAFYMVKDKPGLGGGIFRTVTRISPDSNVLYTNPDGSPYWYTPDPHESEIDNPLYQLWNYDRSGSEVTQNRFIGSYDLRYTFGSTLNAEVSYSFENNSYRSTSISPYDTYVRQGGSDEGFGYSKGSMNKYSFMSLLQALQATINYAESFDDLDVKAKLSYQAIDRGTESFNASGSDFLYKGLPTLDNFDPSTISINSNTTNTREQNYAGIVGLVYDDKFILDGLYRRDGSSLFGANNKWNEYYRVSAAYRLTEDLDINGVDELKINVALGTSGNQPGFSWQYEQTPLNNGSLSTNRIAGNPDLVPSLTTEKEVGLTASFLDGKLTFEGAYSNAVTDDQFMIVSLFSPANAGKNSQWQNVGDLESNTIEAQINAELFNNDDFAWNIGVNYSSSDSNILSVNAPKQFVGTDGLFLLEANTEFGSMWGRVFVDNLDDMAAQLPDGKSISEYSINADGLVVETAAIGTVDEKGIIKVDSAGTDVTEQIGNQNADFRVGMTSNFTYGDFGMYMLWDWKQGGDVYNRNTQWNTISERAAIVDQAGKPDNMKKTRKYYGSLYDVNQRNGFWVEDGTYVKLRELALSWNATDEISDIIPGVTSAKLSIIGRNLLTISDYSGWDPEVTTYDGGTQQYFSVDYGVYPTQSTYSLSLKLNF